jgi:hypothetical protein
MLRKQGTSHSKPHQKRKRVMCIIGMHITRVLNIQYHRKNNMKKISYDHPYFPRVGASYFRSRVVV